MDGFEQAQAFHEIFHPVINKQPTPLEKNEVSARAGFMIEELVEWLSATAAGDELVFKEMLTDLHQAVDVAYEKEKNKQSSKPPANELVGQTDALLDMLYFTYGSFALMAVDPRPLQTIVHEANMGKLFPDGRVHYDSQTGKVLKPANWEKDFAPERKLQNELREQIKRAIAK